MRGLRDRLVAEAGQGGGRAQLRYWGRVKSAFGRTEENRLDSEIHRRQRRRLDHIAYVNWPATEAGLDTRDVVIHFVGVPMPLRLPMSPEQANDFERALRDHRSPD